MCLAIPLGNQDKKNESVLWRTIRTNPLYLLSLGIIIQTALVFIFWLSIKTGLLNDTSLIISPGLVYFYLMVWGIGGFVFFALTMHFYPKKMRTGNIEYLYYGGFFFLANYNLVFFYLASFLSYYLLISSIIIQLLLLLFAFKPIWNAYYWTDKKNKNTGRVVNTLFALLIVGQIAFLFYF